VSAIADHVWQSTWFAFAAWMFALCLRNDRAQVRCWIWLAAALKFLFPFVLFSWIGHQFNVAVDDSATLLPVVKRVASPLTSANVMSQLSSSIQYLLLAIWAPICVLLLQRLLIGWLESRALVSSSRWCGLVASVEVRSSSLVAAPCVVGVLKPVLLLPEALLSDMTQSQFDAVFAHELGHVRRNDNLIAYLQLLIQALFWFHPLIWLIGARLAKEREYACDEAAIERGQEPLAYAANLLDVCKHSMTSTRIGVAYATSANIVDRVRVILTAPSALQRSKLSGCVLVIALIGSVALPVASGMNLIVTTDQSVPPGARLIRISDSTGPSFLVMNDRYVYGRKVSLRELIGRAWGVALDEVSGEMLDHPRYDIEIRAPANAVADQRQLVGDLLERQFNLQLVTRNVSRPVRH
jgi:bla regulator protein BlaR1